MPIRRKRNFRKKSRKRTFRKRKNTNISLTRGRLVVPDIAIMSMKYVQRQAVAPVAGAVFDQVYRGNGMFDPDVTGTGHQPNGFDEWGAFYKVYRVFASKIQTRLVAAATGTAVATAEISIIPSVSSSDYVDVDPEIVRENPQGKGILVMPGAGPQNLNHYMTSEKMLGSKINQNPDASSIFSTVPAQQWFWHINIQAADESTTLDMVLYSEITYYCELSQRTELTVS